MLHKEQSYVFKIARELGIEPKILHHSRDTRTCAEKLALLQEDPAFKDWTLDRIVKALYFHRNNDPFIGVITPEFGEIVKQEKIFPKVKDLKISRSTAEKYWVESRSVPNGMAWGTCSPFPLTSSMRTEISHLIFIDHRPIRDREVNISIGGTDKESFKTSMHIPYMAIHEILRRQFGDAIHLY